MVVAYGKLIPESLLGVPARGFINLHPSLLPRHRGPSPIQWSLVCGDRSTGVTTMQLDEGMDTGPILLQERMAIEALDTAETLSPRLAELGREAHGREPSTPWRMGPSSRGHSPKTAPT